MAPCDTAVGIKTNPYKYVAAKSLHDGQSLTGLERHFTYDRAGWELAKDLLYQRDTLLDFVNANPNPRVNVAFAANRNFKIQSIIGLIEIRAAGIEISP